MTTILTQDGPAEVSTGAGGVGELWLSAQDCESLSGWAPRPEGLCRGAVCIPVPADDGASYVRDDGINLAAFWQLMNAPFAQSADGEVWAFGEAADTTASQLSSLEAPDFALPDLAGNRHALADFRGKKVLLATWASW